MVKLEDFVKRIEKEYLAEKKVEAEKLHNAIAEVIQEHNPDTQTLLFSLEMIRYEFISAKAKELFGTEGPGKKR